MIFSVERQKLLEAVTKLQRIVGAKTSMPVLEGILISAEQGKITLSLFDALGIETVVLEDNYEEQICYCTEYMTKYEKPVALIVRKNTFSEYKYHFEQKVQ